MAAVPLTMQLLRQPAKRVARIIARARLEHVFEKAAPLVVREGELPAIANEDVHDFRVAMRRLRTWMRTCRAELADTVGRRRRRQLRNLSRLAGQVRDLEVQAAWLRRTAAGRDRRAVSAGARLAARYLAEHHSALATLHRALVDRWPDIGAKLGEELQRYSLEVNLDSPDTELAMGSSMAVALRRHNDALRAALEPLPAVNDVSAIHRARIAAKRLRYLLEAFDARTRSAPVALRVLTTLQDDLGELHDAQVLEARVTSVRLPGGTAALHAELRRRIAGAAEAARRSMRRAAHGRLFAEIEALAVRCERASANIVA